MKQNQNWIEKSQSVPEKDRASWQKIWDAAATEIPQPPDIGQGWDQLRRAMANSTPEPKRRWFTMPQFIVPAMAAAVVILVMAISWKPIEELESMIYATARGQQQELTLPDHSRVSLNAASSFHYEANFNKTSREVFLNGEAYFEVEKGEFPFLVRTGIADIKVIGTRFNVWSREELVTVNVSEGRVEVTVPSPDGVVNKQVLTAGQKLTCNSMGFLVDVTPIATQNVALWQEGKLYFEGDPVKRVCREISRYWDVRVEFGDLDIAEETVNGLLEGDADSMIQSVCTLIGRKYRLEKGVYYIE